MAIIRFPKAFKFFQMEKTTKHMFHLNFNSMKNFLFFISFLSFCFLTTESIAQKEKLAGGNMEDSTLWKITTLNTPAGNEPTADWNYTTDKPTAGLNGNLHVKGSTTAGNSQYCIYQAVHLSKDSSYSFDAAYKAISVHNTWCEIYIGTKPVDTLDYGQNQFLLSKFGTWASYSKDDGVFSKDVDNYNVFYPDTTGTYYFVLKTGSTSWDNSVQDFEIIVDELSLMEQTLVKADFDADVTNGMAPLTVNFSDQSKLATAWEWSFGDGSANSTDQNPIHKYNNAGSYTVKLIASNSSSSDTIEKTDLITVNAPQKLTAGGVLKGGDMADMSLWQSSFLNTPSGSEPTVSWNDTTHTPGAGQDGALYVTGNSNNSTVQYCIYQKVQLSKDSVYNFNAAIKDFTANLNQGWLQVFIGTAPIDGEDYGANDSTIHLISEFSTWNNDFNPKGVDGTFATNGSNHEFIPDSTGSYFFVFKLGTTSWAGDDMPFEIAIDELSLTGKRTVPYTAFEADNMLGFAPLTVNFTDKSTFATSWEWNFGDGSAVSNDQNPTHVYAAAGTYDVTLKASNEKGDSTLLKSEFIKANNKPTLPEGEMLYGGNMEDPNLWNITQLNSNAVTEAIWNYTEDTAAYGEGGGLYLTASATNATSNYCIWQKVELKKGKIYTFSGAFKDLSANLDHFWSEVYIGTTAPADGADYGDGQTKIAYFNTWDCGHAKGLDSTYADACADDGTPGVFIPDSDGTYYFALKTGTTDWENNTYSFSVLIDELSLKESENVKADFFADVTSGNAPLTVTFTNLSENATDYLWDFGDTTTSTEVSPIHTYNDAGIYTVKLVAMNGSASDTLTVDSLITVNISSFVPIVENKNIQIYPVPSNGDFTINSSHELINSLVLYNLSGQIIKEENNLNTNKINYSITKSGIYILRVYSGNKYSVHTLIVK